MTAPAPGIGAPPAEADRVDLSDLAERLGLSPLEQAAELASAEAAGTRPLRALAGRFGLATVRRAFFDCLGVPAVDLDGLRVDAAVARRLPAALGERGMAAALAVDPDGTLVVGLADPLDYTVGRQVRAHLDGQAARFVLVDADQLRSLPVQAEPPDAGAFARLVATEVEAGPAADDPDPGSAVAERAPRVGEQLVEQIFERALAARATDVHLDPYRDFDSGCEGLRVRFRIDGTARRQDDLCMAGPTGLRTADIVARTLRMAGGATALSSATQDFRIYREVAGRQVCGRVHTRPAFLGGADRALVAQKTSIRILDGRIRRLEDLGVAPGTVQAWEAASRVSGRLCLVSGPTGSGKTTLLAATIPAIVGEEEIAYSIEDPVEYHQPLLSQLEIQATSREQRRHHMTELLYDLMREDPDFVMVGEIRDRDSMELAFELALRGAQVVTTMHAGSAVHTVQRLLEWGLDPFVVATNLGAILNVRLLRRLCPHCRLPVHRSHGDGVWPAALFGRPLPESGFAKSDHGCAACRSTGTVGQFTIAELLTLEGVAVGHLAAGGGIATLMAGRRTLRDEAVAALAEGFTDVNAVLRAHLGPATGGPADGVDGGGGGDGGGDAVAQGRGAGAPSSAPAEPAPVAVGVPA